MRASNRSHWQHNDIVGFHLKIAATLSKQWGPLQAKSIKTNGEFTIKGKQAKIKELLVDVGRQIKDFQSSHIGYAETAKQLLDSMQPTRDAPDVIAEMRQAEIRSYLQKLEPLDAEVEYRAAAERGDYQFLDAVERAPIAFKFATQALIDKISFARLEKAYPEQAQTLKDVRTAQETVDSALKSVRVSAGQRRACFACRGLGDQRACIKQSPGVTCYTAQAATSRPGRCPAPRLLEITLLGPSPVQQSPGSGIRDKNIAKMPFFSEFGV